MMSNSRRPISANFTSLSLNHKARFIVGNNKKSSNHSNKPSTAHSKYRNSNPSSWELTGNKIYSQSNKHHHHSMNASDFSPTIKVTSLQPSSRKLRQNKYNKQRPQTSNGITSRRNIRNNNNSVKLHQSESNSRLLTYHHINSSKDNKYRTMTTARKNYKNHNKQTFNTSYSSSNVRLENTMKSISSRYGISNNNNNNNNGMIIKNKHISSSVNSNNSHKDSVIFAIDPKHPLCPIVFRDEKSKTISRERLNLDNRNLSKCPILRGEENLRLLNYENNIITKISNLNNLTNLIFLDLYNNRIGKIENLHFIPMLRVLMLGRNQISKIENLDNLHCLDVLDLHSNQISKIENLNHLNELRVLNLAGNDISNIENIHNLKNLVELNLRRNVIYKIDSFITHQKLQRILLSNNNIRDIKTILPISFAKGIQQLTIDNNPFYEKFNNKNTKKTNIFSNPLNIKIVSMFKSLKQLNNFEISDTMRHQLLLTESTLNMTTTTTTTTATNASSSSSSSSSSSNSNVTSSQSLLNIAKAKINKNNGNQDNNNNNNDNHHQLLAQNNNLKENIQSDNNKDNHSEIADIPDGAEAVQSGNVNVISSIQPKQPLLTEDELISKIEQQWMQINGLREHSEDGAVISDRLKHFQLNGNILRMFGCGIPNIDNNDYINIEELQFYYIDFNSLTKYFNYLKTLKTVHSLKFNYNNIHSLYQIDALSVVSHIKNINFGAHNKSNKITTTSPNLYRLYCIFRLPNINEIDNIKVTIQEKEMANKQFSLLRNEWKNSKILLTRGFCAPILNQIRNINENDEQYYKNNINEIFKKVPFSKHNNKNNIDDMDSDELNEFNNDKNKAKQSIQHAVNIYKSRQKLKALWPSIVSDYIEEVINDLQTA